MVFLYYKLIGVYNTMKNFFTKLPEIKKNEIGVKIHQNVFDENFLSILNQINKTLLAQVDRADSKKVSFSFSENEYFIKLEKILKELCGDFYINDFKAHFITSRFPLRIHADTGKDPDDVIGQNILIPISINPENKPVHTVIFKNRWYGPACYFVSKKSDGRDHIFKDIYNKFIDVSDVNVFHQTILDAEDQSIIKFNGGDFLIDDSFRNEVSKLLNIKRYGNRTNEHISNGKEFDKKIYSQHLSHQPYEDLRDLEIDTVYKWNLGDILTWDRSLIHCSDNFINNGVDHKTCIAIQSSKIDKPI